MTSNYDKMSEAASRRFLTFDQEELLRTYPLPADETSIYLRFVGEKYRIDRKTGQVFLCKEPEERAGFDETLSVFDMLTRSPHAPAPTGTWVPLSALASKVGAAPVELKDFTRRLVCYEGRTAQLEAACLAIGGTKVKGGDVSVQIPVFDGFPVWFQYWDADDEFPASVSFLWDETTGQHLHYETLWYIMGHIVSKLAGMAADDLA